VVGVRKTACERALQTDRSTGFAGMMIGANNSPRPKMPAEYVNDVV
jgi:hypothetical protein